VGNTHVDRQSSDDRRGHVKSELQEAPTSAVGRDIYFGIFGHGPAGGWLPLPVDYLFSARLVPDLSGPDDVGFSRLNDGPKHLA